MAGMFLCVRRGGKCRGICRGWQRETDAVVVGRFMTLRTMTQARSNPPRALRAAGEASRLRVGSPRHGDGFGSDRHNKLAMKQEIIPDKHLVNIAIKSASNAYAPYSNFHVGAVLLTRDGGTFAGCNVENLSYGLTICAERSAVFSAVAEGCRDFVKIVVAADTEEPISPCGACRQVLAEFNPDMEIILANFQGKSEHFRLSELLPRPATGILGHP